VNFQHSTYSYSTSQQLRFSSETQNHCTNNAGLAWPIGTYNKIQVWSCIEHHFSERPAKKNVCQHNTATRCLVSFRRINLYVQAGKDYKLMATQFIGPFLCNIFSSKVPLNYFKYVRHHLIVLYHQYITFTVCVLLRVIREIYDGTVYTKIILKKDMIDTTT
jgi:hypothetical protein